jgi:transposase-like protein
MHSYEERMKAVQLFIKYDLSVADTIRELGYPTRNTLIRWYNEYLEKGDLHEKFQKKPRFTQEEKRKAVDYYLEHGRCVRRTVRKLGYPSRTTLTQWIDELAPGERKIRITQGSMVKFSQEQKKEAVISLCTNEASAASLAEKRGIRRETLYNLLFAPLGRELGGFSEWVFKIDPFIIAGELEQPQNIRWDIMRQMALYMVIIGQIDNLDRVEHIQQYTGCWAV